MCLAGLLQRISHSKITQFNCALVFGKQNIGWFQVLMSHTLGMQIPQSLQYLYCDCLKSFHILNLLVRQSLHEALQMATFHELRNNKEFLLISLIPPEEVHLVDDSWMDEASTHIEFLIHGVVDLSGQFVIVGYTHTLGSHLYHLAISL